MRGATRASVARPVRGPWSPAKASARGAGGGKRTPKRNVEFTSPPMARWRATVAEAETSEMHKGFTLWFTGMSGAGKSTISRLLELRLRQFGARVEVLDGDVVRTNLSK